MKILISFTLFILSLPTLSSELSQRNKIFKEAVDLYNTKSYFTALDKIATQYKYETPDQNVQHFIEKIVKHTGTHYFNTYKDLELRKMNIPTTDLVMAKRNLYLKKYKYALKRLKRIPKGHRLFSEAKLVEGTIFYNQNNFDKAAKVWNECKKVSAERTSISTGKIKRYYAVIGETCIINQARMEFKRKNYQKTIRLYEDIPKRSYKWPYILIEKAWAYYHLGDFNRSLGILMTYNSPLLESYFMPEAEVLKALNYYKLCLYEDALIVVNRYYNVFAPQSDKLKKIINRQKGNKYFYNLMFTPIVDSEKSNHFLRNLITQVSKRVKYNLDLNTLYALNTELMRGNNKTNLKRIKSMRDDLEEQINHYVKISMYRFINEIHSLSASMFNLKLEILSNQRSLLYENKKLAKKRGTQKNIKRQDFQDFWTFKSAFWADELGDYTFGLDSKCKSVKDTRI